MKVSLRTQIFREVIANLIVHREYTSAQPCTVIIYGDKVETANANNPHGEGPIDPGNFAPFPKNPTIVKLFIQLGRVEELGSGVLNVNRLLKEYAGGGAPQFIEGPVFKILLPMPDLAGETLHDTINDTIRKRLVQIILHLQRHPGSRISELTETLHVSEVTIKRDMQKMRALVAYRGSKKTGGYFLTDYMLAKLDKKQ